MRPAFARTRAALLLAEAAVASLKADSSRQMRFKEMLRSGCFMLGLFRVGNGGVGALMGLARPPTPGLNLLKFFVR